MREITIDKEFKALIPALSQEEQTQLEANILAEGCRDALIVWDESFILLDGHNRYEICQKHNLSFTTAEIKVATRREAINWIINNQLGRRNLHPDQVSYLRGKRYNGEKRSMAESGAMHDKSIYQNDKSSQTHERLAEEYKVSPATIARDGQFAAAIDTLAQAGIEPQAIIAQASKTDVIDLAKELNSTEPTPLIKQAVASIKTGENSVKETIKGTVHKIKAVKQQAILEPVMTAYITLDNWKRLTTAEQQQYLQGVETGKTFNRQAKDNEDSIGNIEWAKWSWNPVSGCKHDCSYCYARDIANRFYDQGFVPTLYPDRLTAPGNTKVPLNATTDISLKNVFTCSMADLFGRWVPVEWIEAVLQQVRANPQWNFLFLTKFPKRLSEFQFPDNAWLGTTVDCQIRVKAAEDAFRKMREENSGGVWWLSLEPLLEPLEFSSLDMFDWIVIGGASPSTKTPEWHPPRSWVNTLELQAIAAGCRIYEKTNLLSRIRQYPGLDEPEITAAPPEFNYLGKTA